MAQSLTAHEYPLGKIFSTDYDFRIPDYQRPYRWQTDQAAQLLDDLEESLDRADGEPYFLGSLVLVEQGGTLYDVIDGQQRLTTLTILTAVMRDLATKPTTRAVLSTMITEPGNEIDDVPTKPRLALREQDRSFMEQYIQTDGGTLSVIALSDNAASTEPQRRIRDNAKLFHSRLATWDEERLKQLASLMRLRTYLVVVSTADLSSAYRIFSVMNARGLDLQPGDLFKSMVIGALPQGTSLTTEWENAEEALGSEFTDLFRDLRTIVNGERARRELLVEFRSQVLDPYLADGTAAEFVEDLLLPHAKAFEHTMDPGLGPGLAWEQVNVWLRRLGQLDNKDWRPLALWALVNHADDAEFLGQFFARLERLWASMLLRGEYSTPRVERSLKLLAELKAGHGLESPSLDLTETERAEALAGLQGDVYRMQSRRARYVLLRLDALLADDPGATYSHNIISIEHVLPQSPATDSMWVANFTEEERQHWTHKLGNLLLLNRRKNSQASNYDFAKKKSGYFTSTNGSAVFALTTQVISTPEWTPDVVAQRQTELVKALATEWELI